MSLDALRDAVPAVLRVPLTAVVAALAGWTSLHAFVLLVTRPRPLRPGPVRRGLTGDETPAVVSVLTGGWSVTEDAAAATLLDLAARGYLELRQPDADPAATTVQVVADEPTAARAVVARQARIVRVSGGDRPLTDYERKILDRVRAVAPKGVVPLTALAFRDPAQARRWAAAFTSDVLADARLHGLVQRRVPVWVVTLLSVSAVVPALAVSWLAWVATGRSDVRHLALGLVPAVLLVPWAMRGRGRRGTRKGRELAAEWLGVRRYLEGEGAFADMPPSAVALWDRYLGYGTALGITRAISALVDLGTADRRRPWSAYGGQWHQVRVRYPRAVRRYGAPAFRLVAESVVTAGTGFGLMLLYRLIEEGGLAPANGLLPSDRLRLFLLMGGGGLLAAAGVYRFLRAVLDLVTSETLQGEVLRIAPWARPFWRRRDPDLPRVHYLAVDDGTSDRTTAWALPPDVVRGFGPGAVVEVTVRPWSRRVTALTVLQARSLRPAPTTGAVTLVGAGPPEAAQMVTSPLRAGELAARLGVPLEPAQAMGLAGVWRYPVAADRGEVLLAAGRGRIHRTLFDLHRQGHRLDRVGDEAYLLSTGAVARAGDVVVRIAVPSALGIPPEGVAAALAATLYAVLDDTGPKEREQAHGTHLRSPG